MGLKKHVITGGPCTGKTTTVESLRQRGFRIIEEASRRLIDEQLASGGDLLPWKRLFDFNIAVTKLQLELESRATEGVWFADRGIVDNIAYCEWGGIEPPPQLVGALKKARYGKIFLLLPLEIFENEDVRRESREDAEKLTVLIRKAYQEQGYVVVDVPALPVEERVGFILGKI